MCVYVCFRGVWLAQGLIWVSSRAVHVCRILCDSEIMLSRCLGKGFVQYLCRLGLYFCIYVYGDVMIGIVCVLLSRLGACVDVCGLIYVIVRVCLVLLYIGPCFCKGLCVLCWHMHVNMCVMVAHVGSHACIM